MGPDRAGVTIQDVIAVAEQLEASAAETYRQAAGKVDATTVREALLGLAEMEDEHRRYFTSLRAASGEPSGPVSEDMLDFFEAWTDGRLFPDPDAPPSGAGAGNDVTSWLHTAVSMEKESIAFYSGLREMVGAAHRDTVDDIIEEELRHLVTLGTLLRQAQYGGG